MVPESEVDRLNTNTDSLATLAMFVGRKLSRADRIFFVFDSEVERAAGPLELIFDGGDVLLFEVGPDGERLQVSRTPWVDGIESFPTAENLEFAPTHRKWTRFDVSSESGYRDLIDQRIEDIGLVQNPHGKVTGVIIRCGRTTLRVDVEFDELYVQLG
jgi:hypothetical protein